MSIHQQALRGIALVALERGDKAGAKAQASLRRRLRGLTFALACSCPWPACMPCLQYERILGKAALGRGPAEHWAHADYGWLLYQEGDLQNARQQLEQAIQVSISAGCTVTDSQVRPVLGSREGGGGGVDAGPTLARCASPTRSLHARARTQLAEHHYRLGEVYWKLRGRYRSDKQFAYTQFYEAAKVEGHAQALALAALGRFFQVRCGGSLRFSPLAHQPRRRPASPGPAWWPCNCASRRWTRSPTRQCAATSGRWRWTRPSP